MGWRLFFGCRREDSDYYYARDWLRLVQRGALQGLHTAFSRSGKFKVYVTKRLLEQRAWVGRALLDEGAHVFIAGSANRMPRDVKDILADCVEWHLASASRRAGDAADEGSFRERAAAVVRGMEKSGRLKVEAWG